MMSGVKRVDSTTKIMLIILAVVVSYLVLFSFLTGLFVQRPSSMHGMMHYMIGSGQNAIVAVLVVLSLALLVGVLVSLRLRTESTTTRTDELEIIKRALSDDEKAVLDEIRRAGEITQDSLRFRLGWSKAKVSRVLTNLDKINLIQRERTGKTYNVFIREERRKEEEGTV